MAFLTFGDILAPHTVSDFLTGYFGARPLAVPGPANRFASLASTPGFPTGSESVDEHDGPVKMLARELERVLEARVRATFRRGSEAIAAHRGERDRFVLQLSGASRWRFWDKSDEQPVGEGTESVLTAGHALYVPKGWWQAASRELAAEQLEFQIENPTGADLLQWLLPRLQRHEYFQADLPRFSAPGAQADYLTGMRRIAVRALRAPGLLESFHRHLAQSAPARPISGPQAEPPFPEHHVIAMAARFPLRLRRADTDTLLLKCSNEEFRFPMEAAQFIQFLEDQAPVPVGEFHRTFEPQYETDELDEFLAVMVRGGMVAVTAPGSVY